VNVNARNSSATPPFFVSLGWNMMKRNAEVASPTIALGEESTAAWRASSARASAAMTNVVLGADH